VRILEGNLRIRKAQMIRSAQILGTIDAKEHDDPATEYDRAAQLFSDTHDMYMPSYVALSQMVDSKASPARYLEQIAGRSKHVFQAAAPIPEAAVQYLRDEPEVQRVVAVEGDLGEITADIVQAEATISRLEAMVAAGDRNAVYPALASRRARVGALEAQVIKLRNDLAEQELRLVASAGELANLTAARRQQYAAFAALPDPERAAADHLVQNRVKYDAIEESAAEVDDAIGATQATSVAVRKYLADTPDLPADRSKTTASSLDEAAHEAEAIERELEAVHREILLGRDLAGIGDTSVASAAAARAKVRAAQDAEHRALAGYAAGSRDRERSQQLVALGDRAGRLAEQLAGTLRQIDSVVDQGLQEIRGMIRQERATLASYKAELAGHEAESRSLGATVLAARFKDVKAKFYDIVIRTDVGNVDVSWSQKEDTDDDLKRLNLSRQRELKQLRDAMPAPVPLGAANERPPHY